MWNLGNALWRKPSLVGVMWTFIQIPRSPKAPCLSVFQITSQNSQLFWNNYCFSPLTHKHVRTFYEDAESSFNSKTKFSTNKAFLHITVGTDFQKLLEFAGLAWLRNPMVALQRVQQPLASVTQTFAMGQKPVGSKHLLSSLLLCWQSSSEKWYGHQCLKIGFWTLSPESTISNSLTRETNDFYEAFLLEYKDFSFQKHTAETSNLISTENHKNLWESFLKAWKPGNNKMPFWATSKIGQYHLHL